jgi:hypothetical protein
MAGSDELFRDIRRAHVNTQDLDAAAKLHRAHAEKRTAPYLSPDLGVPFREVKRVT